MSALDEEDRAELLHHVDSLDEALAILDAVAAERMRLDDREREGRGFFFEEEILWHAEHMDDLYHDAMRAFVESDDDFDY